jgi:DNA-directed RNA polymerase subunit RPC12/RpoP
MSKATVICLKCGADVNFGDLPAVQKEFRCQGCGQVIVSGKKGVVAYRDLHGNLHFRSNEDRRG